jgi:copper chaperone NosL
VSHPSHGSAAGGGVERPSIHPGAGDVCAVCGLSVSRHPEWAAEAVHEDGTQVFFDGPKDLFRYLRHPDHYAGERSKIEAAFVTAYYDRVAVPARDALYVLGSDVVGPLGAELVPHRTREDAEEFMVDHQGRRILTYPEVGDGLLASLG